MEGFGVPSLSSSEGISRIEGMADILAGLILLVLGVVAGGWVLVGLFWLLVQASVIMVRISRAIRSRFPFKQVVQ